MTVITKERFVFPEYGDETWGGFFLANILKSLVNDIMSSGDPESYFEAVDRVMDDINDYIAEHGYVDTFNLLEDIWNED